MLITYNWYHIETKTKGTRTKFFVNRMSFYESLNKWNKQGLGQWHYYE